MATDTPTLRLSRWRMLELGCVLLAPIGLVYLLDDALVFERGLASIPASFDQWLWWLALVAWSVEPAVLCPLTHPGRSPQQRSIVLSLIGGAALSWWLLLGRMLEDSWSHYEVSTIGLLLTFGFAAAAVVLRLGWGPLRLEDIMLAGVGPAKNLDLPTAGVRKETDPPPKG